MSERAKLILLPSPKPIDDAFKHALKEDLNDLLTEYTFDISRVSGNDSAEVVSCLKGAAPTLMLATDMLNPSPAVIESMVEALELFDVVLCPSIDTSVVALSCYLDEHEAPNIGERLAQAMLSGEPCLAKLSEDLVEAGLNVMVQPPWYRASSGETDTRFALAHMDAMLATGDEDFIAERTRMILRGGQ